MGSKSNVHFADKTLAGVPALLSDLGRLLEDRQTTDVIFVIGHQELYFHAHKLILWARCVNFQKLGHDLWNNQRSKGTMVVTYPELDPDVFRQVLVYIYTGKIILQDNSVFHVMTVASELGIPELQNACSTHVTSTLAPPNACRFYAASRDMEQNARMSGLRDTDMQLSSLCKAYIEENAEQVVKTEEWLTLDKDAILSLISSDSFALEEEEVWRAVLSWAKHHSGVPQGLPPVSWNDSQKTLVAEQLSGLVDEVKLLLIDSVVFAEEVEPTGCVPMELSLARYRYAAVPEKFHASEDRRLQPRVCHKLFQGTHVLAGDKLQLQRQLNSWYGDNKQKWKLLYRASRDGSSATDFHRLCDGQAPTFVIIQGTTGNICGGFSDVPWTSHTPSKGKYMKSDRAFLFTLINNQGVPPTKFSVAIPQYATLQHPSYGPMFGAGADLCIANNCQSGMECYSNLPHSYHGNNASCSLLMGDYNFNVLDYEVFTLAHPSKDGRSANNFKI